MPILYIKYPDKHAIMSVWHITETAEELAAELDLTPSEQLVLNSYRHENRKKQWLSYRLLIKKLQDDTFRVHYTDYGKPYLHNDQKSKHVSITHSGDYSAVIIHPEASVGIDIEKVTKRIDRVSSKFLSAQEIEFIDREHALEHMTICWTAKEAIFKVYGNEYYDFKQQILLHPFKFSDSGTIKCTLKAGTAKKHYLVSFDRITDYFLAYVSI